MPSVLLDDFADLSSWTAIASGQAQLHLVQEGGPHGTAMRLEFDFQEGGGFVVARKPFSFPLPQAYAFSFMVRGVAPANRFEFKLVDPSGHNVWWFHQDGFAFPADWQSMRISSSQIEFAWGPLGGGSMATVGAIELVIAAGPGGQGTVWLAELRFADTTPRLQPLVQASSALPDHAPELVLDPSSDTSWRSDAAEASAWLQLDFQEERDYGGLTMQWEPATGIRQFDVQVSHDGVTWQTVYAARQAHGARSDIYLPHSTSRYVRLHLHKSTGRAGFGIVHIAIQPVDFSRSITTFFEHIARSDPKGWYPKYLYRQQTYWTVVGIPAVQATQGLINEEGLVEVDTGSFSIEPFMYVDGAFFTWAEAQITQELEGGYLPIPSSCWQARGMTLQITACATGDTTAAVLYIRYRIGNTLDTPQRGHFFAALRPFQVTPPWQAHEGLGGVSAVRSLAYIDGTVRVNNQKIVIPLSTPDGFGAAAFEQGAITAYLHTGILPPHTQVHDDFGYASGALAYALDLAPHAMQEISLAIPFGTPETDQHTWRRLLPVAADIDGAAPCAAAVRDWETTLAPLEIHLPTEAQRFVDTCKTAAAHILINRAGPALHPGPRRYRCSWIRDGAIMAAALLRIGCAAAVRDFLRWYATYQAEDGNVPCCVDQHGADWLPEYDSQGEFIYTIMEYFRCTGDRAFLVDMWPAVIKAVHYLEGLRQQRLTPQYETPEKRAYYGLLPESASHEGYLAHPAHAYWDDFWALRGLKDAASMAQIVGDSEQASRLAALRDAFRETLRASLQRVISERHLEYIPGAVEFADFDPTATAVALTQIDELPLLPAAAVDATFEKYVTNFWERHTGKVDWANYTPYEIRTIGALVRLGKRLSAYALTEFFLSDCRPPAWQQWPEIAWREAQTPGHLGDLPHSWISAEYILSFLSMLAFERDIDAALVIAAGIPEAWLTAGVTVRNLPTHYGALTYSLRQESAHSLRLSLGSGLALSPGRVVVKPPLPAPLVQVEVNGESIDTFDADSAVIHRCPAEIILHMGKRQDHDTVHCHLPAPDTSP